MSKMIQPVIVASDLMTAYGHGIDVCWWNLMTGTSMIQRVERFCTESFQSDRGAFVPSLSPVSGDRVKSQQMM